MAHVLLVSVGLAQARPNYLYQSRQEAAELWFCTISSLWQDLQSAVTLQPNKQ